jgi:hypothetical protein
MGASAIQKCVLSSEAFPDTTMGAKGRGFDALAWNGIGWLLVLVGSLFRKCKMYRRTVFSASGADIQHSQNV